MIRILLLGAPGSGKGTQAAKITEIHGIPAISTGDILRANIAEGTPLGLEAKRYMDAGELVPDDLIIALMENRLFADDLKNGYLLDGFPRTVAQAEALDELLEKNGGRLDQVFYLTAPKEALIRRISGRRVCSGCGKIYHMTNSPPKTEGVCDVCGAAVIQRKDDNEATVENRIEVYEHETMPLVGYYERKGILTTLDGSQDSEAGVNAVEEKIDEVLGAL